MSSHGPANFLVVRGFGEEEAEEAEDCGEERILWVASESWVVGVLGCL